MEGKVTGSFDEWERQAARTLDEQRIRHAALRYIIEAWEEAVYDGLHPDQVASAALFAAISEMVTAYGEDMVAKMVEDLPERIRRGEFTLYHTKQ